MLVLDALGRVLPVLLLFALGALLRRTGFLAETTVADLRRLVLTVTLPSALFLTFLRVSLEACYLPIVAAVFAACVLMLVVGPVLVRGAGVRSWYGGPLLTGFEAGMLGYAIYGGVFRQEAAGPERQRYRPLQREVSSWAWSLRNAVSRRRGEDGSSPAVPPYPSTPQPTVPFPLQARGRSIRNVSSHIPSEALPPCKSRRSPCSRLSGGPFSVARRSPLYMMRGHNPFHLSRASRYWET